MKILRNLPWLYVHILENSNWKHPARETIIRQNYQNFKSSKFDDYLSPEKLRTILKTFGGRCLIILDGLDEHDVTNNKDLRDIINDNSFLWCIFLFTTTSNMAKSVKKICQTIVTLKGLNEDTEKRHLFVILDQAC